ncbi:MAG: hypothetical protein Q7T03_01815 [Deltaproteobacteria bacterium]|nr:hypothetical protein [Deltaproteobacteria bacterium]
METVDFKKLANPREQILALLVVLALLAMFFRVIYAPKREATQQLQSQIQNLKLEKEALEKFTEALRNKQPLPEGGKETSSLKMQILKGEVKPIVNKTATLLAFITSQQFLRGVRIKGMSDIPPKSLQGYKRADFFLDAQGPFRSVISYVDRIEQTPALVLLENLSIKSIDTKATQVDMELNGTLFELEEKNGK